LARVRARVLCVVCCVRGGAPDCGSGHRCRHPGAASAITDLTVDGSHGLHGSRGFSSAPETSPNAELAGAPRCRIRASTSTLSAITREHDTTLCRLRTQAIACQPVAPTQPSALATASPERPPEPRRRWALGRCRATQLCASGVSPRVSSLHRDRLDSFLLRGREALRERHLEANHEIATQDALRRHCLRVARRHHLGDGD